MDDKVVKCYYCERELKKGSFINTPYMVTIDHIIPISKGGNNLQINKVKCCRKCNGFKTNMTPSEFLGKVNSIITTSGKWKSYDIDKLMIVYKNAEALQKLVETKGEKMMQGYKEPKAKPKNMVKMINRLDRDGLSEGDIVKVIMQAYA
jgi:CRISPR/Cas system Type II protein with McrA/HNH and RuvC-like nuclease domain